MAAITERGGRFQARVRRDGFKTVSKTFTRKADATAWARRVEADMEAGRWVEASAQVPTLSDAIDRYHKAVGHKHKGAADYAYRYGQIKREAFAGKPIDAVTPRELSEWRDRIAGEAKPATVVRRLALLSAVFTWAVKERGWAPANPLALVARPRVDDARNRTLNDDELAALTAAAETSKARWLAPALIILSRSAMRRGELFKLRRDDIDFDARVARLSDTKNGSARDVPLCPRSLAALRALADDAKARDEQCLLPVDAAGSISTRFAVTVRRAQTKYREQCTAKCEAPDASFLAGLRLHDLRHHAVTAWASTGELGLVELMAISGHKNPRMLARYTHLKASALAQRMAALAS